MTSRSLVLGLVLVFGVAGVQASPGYYEGFESPSWTSNTSAGWNDYDSIVLRAASGTDGISSYQGNYHGIIDSSNVTTYTGAFGRLGGYSSTFGGGFTNQIAVYLDLNAASLNNWSTYGFDLDSAVNDNSGGFLRDFIFHAAASSDGSILIAGSNNTNFARRNDLASINHFSVTQSGWYVFEWKFRDFGNSTLAVDLNLKDANGNWLWTETRNSSSDVLSGVGGNRYMWFNFAATNRLAIDGASVSGGQAPSVPAPAAVIPFAIGLLARLKRRK